MRKLLASLDATGSIPWLRWLALGAPDQITELRLREGLAELAFSGRQSLVGELAATIAHEISQPLGATFTNTETLEVLLQSPAPDLAELRKIAADLRYDSLRAVDVIRHLRKFLKRSTLELREVDLAEPVRDSIQSSVKKRELGGADRRLCAIAGPEKGTRVL